MAREVRKKRRKITTSEPTQNRNSVKVNNSQSIKDKSMGLQDDGNLGCNSNNSTTNYLELGLDRFSYADYVLLSSLLAYSIGEELNDVDLDLLIVFFSMISSDLALVRTKRGVFQRKQAANAAQAKQNSEENAVIDTIISGENENIASELTRKTKIRNKKIIRKRVTKSIK